MTTALEHLPQAQPTLRLCPTHCPRCGSTDTRPLHSGADYLYGVPGTFHAVVCCNCGLGYQNPRICDDDLAQAYPTHYGPHAQPAAAANATPEEHASPAIVRAITYPFRRLYAGWRFVLLGSYFVYMKRRLGYPQPCRRRPLWLSHVLLLFTRGWASWKCRADMLPRWVDGGNILEAGCGSGWNMERLRGLGWTTQLGIDLSPQAVAAVRAKGFKALCGPLEEVLQRVPNASYDVVFSSMALEHLADPFAVIRQLAGKLKPGGQLILSTVIIDSIECKLHGNYGPSFDFPRHLVYFRRADLRALLQPWFDNIEVSHQAAPQDLVRPARWRRDRSQERWCDRLVLRLEGTHTLSRVHTLLAWLRATSRVSVRCTRKECPA